MHAALRNMNSSAAARLGQALFIVLLIFSGSVWAQDHSPPAPSAWKAAKPVKASGCDRKRKDLLSAIADFDGDGKRDTAKILAKKRGKGLGVWVWLSSQKDPKLIATAEHEDGKHDMGIAVVEPGTYDTGCGKGFWDCNGEEQAKLTLTNSAIDFFTCESANRFLYWDAKEKKFKSIWMSD